MNHWWCLSLVRMLLCWRKRSKKLIGKIRLVRKKVKGIPKKGKVKLLII